MLVFTGQWRTAASLPSNSAQSQSLQGTRIASDTLKQAYALKLDFSESM